MVRIRREDTEKLNLSDVGRYLEGNSLQDSKLYEELDEDDYQRMTKKKLIDGDNFVEDDDGQGYADYGQLENESDSDDFGSEEEDEPTNKKSKSKKDKNKPVVVKKERQISSFFANAVKQAKPAATVENTKNDVDFMESILAEVDEDVSKRSKKRAKTNDNGFHTSSPPKVAMKPVKIEPVENDVPMFPDPPSVGMDIDDIMENNSQIDLVDFVEDPVKPEPVSSSPAQPEAHLSDDEILSDSEEQPQVVGAKVKSLSKSNASTKAKSIDFQSALKKFEKPTPKLATVVKAPTTANCEDWSQVKDRVSSNVNQSAVISRNFQFNDSLEPDGSLRMFWIDACEVNGGLYLFGKVVAVRDGFVSCCIKVEGMERNLYFLPRERKFTEDGTETDIPVAFTDVYEEVEEILYKQNIKSFQSKPTTRKYAFEIPGIPAEAEYMKVKYKFSDPPIPRDLSGQTFSHVFATHQNQLELFLLKRKIMGPCWLIIEKPEFMQSNVSWCKFIASVSNPKMISPVPETDASLIREPPPLVAMSLSMIVATNPKTKANEIIALSATVYDDVHLDESRTGRNDPRRFTIIRQYPETVWPMGFSEITQNRAVKIEMAANEFALLNSFIAKLHLFDPDVIVGHNFVGFGLDVLLRRMKDLNINFWSRIGRLQRKTWPKLQSGPGGIGETTFEERAVVSGRLICDTYLAAKETVKAKSYSLTSLAETELKWRREEVDYDHIQDYFWDKDRLRRLVEMVEFDGIICVNLMFHFQYLQLSRQLTNLAGNLWSKTLMSGKADRNEFLLLHEFYNNKFIVPDKRVGPKKGVKEFVGEDDDDEPGKSATSGRRKPAYAGGLVLEPKKGFYDKYVILFDFNSLYPSIIQEYNICFTTVERGGDEEKEEKVPDVPDSKLERGILPKLLATLVNRRRQVKGLMKDPKVSKSLYAQYNIRQQALKLTANSMYGCLGFTNSRFYAKPLAMLVTAKGREILQETAALAADNHYEVIYGDTDSIMIHSNTEDLVQVRKICVDFKKAVNQRYRLLELEVDNLYKRMLLLKKKKYAGLAVVESGGKMESRMEIKGLDLVRRDWCGLAQDVSMQVLKELFDENDQEDRLDKINRFLQLVGKEVKEGVVPIEKFMIIKALTKKPEAYADAKTQPHVQVALKMRANNINVRPGETIPYVVCVDTSGQNTDTSLAQKAQPPYELQKKDTPYQIDFDWYLANQVHPCISRLCVVIEGIDSVQIADMLGIDSSKFHQQTTGDAGVTEDQVHTLQAGLSFEERFATVEKWTPNCTGCNEAILFEPVVRINKNGEVISAFDCPKCHTRISTSSLVSLLRKEIEKQFHKWDTSPYVCDDYGHKRHDISASGAYCLGKDGATVKKEYTDEQLRLQIVYYLSLFDKGLISNGDNPLRIFDKDVQERATLQVHRDAEDLQKMSYYAKKYVDVHGGYIVDLSYIWRELIEE
ncbi:DNA-directed DNA polymerase alpha catalytic subunit pol1 [Nowakowskiella sp. JEL0407]|nr:DNA-directed DNA polymerase alpha catalytic subunit pol1 [Nowakowskiella sp. JEL0407]